jgi:hypothetical protein
MDRTSVAVLVLALPCVAAAQKPPASASAVPRGEYLVTIMGCHDCHTPKKMGPNGPEPDFSRSLIGHPAEEKLPPPPKLPPGPWMAVGSWQLSAWSGPWGISYATNLTPDENTGMGIWTEEMFLEAMKTGRHMGASRPILPPMPWQTLAATRDEDLKAIFAYLRSLKPVSNRVPEAVVAEPPAPAK